MNPNITDNRAPQSVKPLVVEKGMPDSIGSLVEVEINGTSYKIPIGTTILEACRMNGIHIPTLCHHEDLCLAGVCRICVVEVEGMRVLPSSCTFPITNKLKVKTTSEKVRKARRHILDLMLSEHYGECYSCVRNNNCELQRLAKEYGVDFYRFGHVQESKYPIDRSSYSVIRDMDKCILCKRCVRTCIDLQEVGVLEATYRGNQTTISTFFDKPLGDVICINCGQCINRCPTGALHANDPSDDIWNAIDNPAKHVIIQTAPSPRAAIGEEFGLEPGAGGMTYKLNTAMKMIGFDKVFDTNFSADLTIMEEGTELLLRLKKLLVDGDTSIKLPQFTSCSPGWIKYIEHFYPEYLDYLSSCKSPQQMFGAVTKTFYAQENGIDPADIITVAVMPCSAKKFECNRPEMADSGYKDIDYGLTTRELAQMIREAGLKLPDLPDSEFDNPFADTGSGLIFGATGGVMESALRTAYELVTGRPVPFENLQILPCRGFEGVRQASVKLENVKPEWSFLEGVDLNFMIAHGTANAKKVMEALKRGELSNIHFIEVMACPGGCIGGGGQPIPTSPEIRRKRAESIYKEAADLPINKSFENPSVKYIYEKFFTDGPCGHLSHKLLHTHYTKRGKYIA